MFQNITSCWTSPWSSLQSCDHVQWRALVNMDIPHDILSLMPDTVCKCLLMFVHVAIAKQTPQLFYKRPDASRNVNSPLFLEFTLKLHCIANLYSPPWIVCGLIWRVRAGEATWLPSMHVVSFPNTFILCYLYVIICPDIGKCVGHWYDDIW